MDTLSVCEAKACFSTLVERAETGRSTVITKHGRVVAKIVPAGVPEWDRAVVLDDAEAFRKSLKLKGRISVRKLIEQGRR